jgi:lipoate synthase
MDRDQDTLFTGCGHRTCELCALDLGRQVAVKAKEAERLAEVEQKAG